MRDTRWYEMCPGDERKLRKAFGRQWAPDHDGVTEITEEAIRSQAFPALMEFEGYNRSAKCPFTTLYLGPCFAPLMPLALAASFDACGFRGYTPVEATAHHGAGRPPTAARFYLSAIRTDLVLQHINHRLYPMDYRFESMRGKLWDTKGRLVVEGEPLRGLDAGRPRTRWTSTELVSSRVKLWAEREGQVQIDFVPVDLVIDGQLVKHEDLPDVE